MSPIATTSWMSTSRRSHATFLSRFAGELENDHDDRAHSTDDQRVAGAANDIEQEQSGDDEARAEQDEGRSSASEHEVPPSARDGAQPIYGRRATAHNYSLDRPRTGLESFDSALHANADTT
jgi:hypothetical protein